MFLALSRHRPSATLSLSRGEQRANLQAPCSALLDRAEQATLKKAWRTFCRPWAAMVGPGLSAHHLLAFTRARQEMGGWSCWDSNRTLFYASAEAGAGEGSRDWWWGEGEWGRA